MNKETKYNFTIFVLFLVIIWAPAQAFVAFDGAYRIPFILSIVAVLMNGSEIKALCFRKPIAFYLLLAPYMFISGLIHGSQSIYSTGGMGIYLMAFSIFQPLLVMLLVICLSSYRFDKTLKYITIAILAYCILGFASGKMTDYGDDGERFECLINSNEVALMIAIGFFCVLLLYVRKQITLSCSLFIAVLLVIAVISTASRMGFVMIGIVSVLSIIMLGKQRRFRSLYVSLLLLLSFFFFLYFVMENTFVGERLMTTTRQAEFMEMATGTFWDKFGDRGLQYYYGWPFIIEHPLFGIGFHQWINVGPLGLVCHSEYLVQSLENGLVGSVLYVSFFVGLIRRILLKLNVSDMQESRTNKVFLCIFLSVVFANSVLWTYTSTGVFAIYGMLYVQTANHYSSKITKFY